MSFIAGYLLGLGQGGSDPVIKSLTVTANGRYEAPEGVDGYDPVIVGVPDRYDEGYKDGYKDAKDLNQKIIEQLNGDLPSVTDDNGNTIENAIVSDNSDYTNDILKNIVFSGNGGSVTVQNLGSDAKAELKVSRVYNNDGINCGARVDLIVTNTITGFSNEIYCGSLNKSIDYSDLNVKIDSWTYTDDMTRLNIWFHFYDNGGDGTMRETGSFSGSVGAEKFVAPDKSTAITQQQG